MTDLDKLAKELTGEQREALLAPHWGYRVPLIKAGLAYWTTGPHGREIIKLRPLGLSLKAHIERNTHAE